MKRLSSVSKISKELDLAEHAEELAREISEKFEKMMKIFRKDVTIYLEKELKDYDKEQKSEALEEIRSIIYGTYDDFDLSNWVNEV
ncbi:MAG: hypothetical protein WC934_12170 [Acidithiobacillus sp.]|jgi:hypothetical protein|uniref:hypothetical protein n=1 Tax=Acidithiobacillus sp. TaxID=1872118 RepID=UPI0035606E2F